jgi:predicted alpha-1,2-mannosidase
VGYHHYQYKKNETRRVALDLFTGIGWDRPTDTYIKQVDATTFVGYRMSSGWAEDQRLWFAIKTSVPVKNFGIVVDSAFVNVKEKQGRRLVGQIDFGIGKGKVEIKVGISPVSSENALKNIQAEIPAWNFESIKMQAQEKWNKALSVATVTTSTLSEKRTFYTALYHSMIAPVLFNDHDQTYRGTDKRVYSKPGYDHYSVFSLWDTYRQWHPLMTLLAPQKVPDFVSTMLDIYDQQGKLPVWPLMGSETNCMVGYSAVPVLADAIMKDFKGFDYEKAFQAMKTTAMGDEFGLQYLKKDGFIPAEQEVESVSKAMEYAIGDKCIAMVAQKLGHEEDRKYFEERAGYYKRYFDKNSRFVRGVMSDGKFREPFDPFNIVHMKSDFTEGNAWQYTFMVPQDLENYTALFGGKEAFLKKLDSLFVVTGDLGAEASPDVSGLIGMYAQGNEPEHHVPYLYSVLGRPNKTAEKVKEITSKFYTDKPDGICGNDDCGQMSAWYVASAMGFYQVHPADGKFYVGTPHFSNIRLKVGEKNLNITAKNFGRDNIYVKKITLNGKPIDRTYLTYSELAAGGNLVFEMGR